MLLILFFLLLIVSSLRYWVSSRFIDDKGNMLPSAASGAWWLRWPPRILQDVLETATSEPNIQLKRYENSNRGLKALHTLYYFCTAFIMRFYTYGTRIYKYDCVTVRVLSFHTTNRKYWECRAFFSICSYCVAFTTGGKFGVIFFYVERGKSFERLSPDR